MSGKPGAPQPDPVAVQMHIGPGCSEGCWLFQGGSSGRNAIMEKIHDMMNEDRNAGYSTDIYINMSPLPRSSNVTLPEYP